MGQVTLSEGCPHARRGERRDQSGAFKPWLPVGLVLAIMPYARIDVDVNMAEEAELWRMERGCASPRAPAMVDGMVPSWGIGVPLAQMNMEAGAANEQADAAGRQVQWQWPMVAAAVPPTPVVVVASAPPLDMPFEVVMAQARTDATEEDADSAVQINSTVQAARQCVRGPTISEKRLKAARDAEAADGMQKAASKRKQHDQSTEGMGGRLVAVAQPIVTPVASLGVRRGRERANAPLPGAGDAPMQSELRRRRTALKDKGATRRSKLVSELAPAGAAVFQSAPNRADYPMTDLGAKAFEDAMLAFTRGNLDDAGAEMRTLDTRELAAGAFGHFCDKRGHGSYIKWVPKPTGWAVEPVRVSDEIVVPTPVMIMDWILRMVNGDKEVCPKGYNAEYRNGPWYKPVQGKEQGARMTEENEKACGHGAFADDPCVYTTIEQKISKLRKWYDGVLQDTSTANPFRNVKIERMLKTMAKHLGRGRRHVPEMMKLEFVKAVLLTTRLDETEEVLIASYMAKNITRGTRAQDEFMLDWCNVTWHAPSEDGSKCGLAFDYAASKNNKEQEERANGLQCTSCCKQTVERDEDGKLLFASFCPVHLLLHAKSLQARDVGVPVDRLKGPVWATYKKIADVPSGATLVASDSASEAQKAKALVMVVTRAQEAAGLMYDRSVPFVINGRAYQPPCRGVWFEIPGMGYAVHAWASAAGVTHRIRMRMQAANRRSPTEVIPEATIKRLSSKSHRIAMATLLLRKGVPASEVVQIGEWEDEAMMRTYVRVLDPFAPTARHITDVMWETGTTAAQTERAVGSGGADALIVSVQELIAAVNSQRSLPVAPNQIVEPVAEPTLEPVVEQTVEVEPTACELPAAQVEAMAEAAAEPTVEVNANGCMAGGVEATPAQALPRKRERDKAEYKPCCDKYVVGWHTLKRARIEDDGELQATLHEVAGMRPAAAKQALCKCNYHVTSKEVMNYRNRQRQAVEVAQRPAADMAALAAELAGQI